MTDIHYRPDCRPLDRAAERHYLKLARAGDESAKDALVRSLLPYVIKLARSAARRSGGDLDDLVQAGSLGLVEAIGSFDLRRSTRLITHAHHYILRHIRREVWLDNLIRVPEAVAFPAPNERPDSQRRACAEAALRPKREYDDTALVATESEPQFYSDEIERLHAAIQRLPKTQRRVIEGKLAGKTLAELASQFRRSKQGQHQQYHTALKNLRAMLAEPNEPREAAA